jgi:serine/threonine-protein kinase
MKLCPKCQKQFSDDANFCPVDAARLMPLEASAPGQDALTSRFDLGQQLGGSRTGSVYRATDKSTGRPCAVKLIAPAVLALPGVAQRLERELKQLERVKSSGVCQVLASGKRGAATGEEHWVATELLDGAQTLDDAIRARGALPLEQAADLIEVIGEALIEAAQVGVVHRDLAPKNILFAGQDIKLINFSVPVPTNDKVPGVAEFVAPEQVEGRPVDQRSNLYSLGALYYYVLTGQTLFVGAPADVHQQHVTGTIRPPSQLVNVPAPVEAVIMRALDRSPTKRFLTVRQFVDEVTRVGHGEVIELNKLAAAQPRPRNRGELVQTLLGVNRGPGASGGLPPVSSAPTINPQPPVIPAQAPAPAATPVIQPMGTMLGQGPSVLAQVQAAVAAKQQQQQQQPPVQAQPPGSAMAASLSSSPAGMAPLTPPAGSPATVPPAAPSPWGPPIAQPIAQPPAPVAAQPVVAPPVVAPPVVAPPQVAAPQVAQAAAAAPAGKKKAPAAEDAKGKFRETMWFKKGDLDAQAAIAAAEERARTGKDAATDKADTKPIEDRYNDDGSVTRADKEKYSLRTGATQMMPSMKDMPGMNASQSMSKVSEDALIGEMKGLPKWLILTIVIGVLAIAGILIVFLS